MQIPIESFNLQMLNVGFAQHDGDWNWQDIDSPFTRLYYVKGGTAKLHLPNGVQVLRPGHLYMVPAYTVHSYECDSMFCHYYLHVYEAFKKEVDVFELYDFPAEVEARPGDEALFAEMCQAHPEARLLDSDPSSYDNNTNFADYVKRYNQMALWEKMQIRGATLMLLSRFMEHAVPKRWTSNERLSHVLAYIHKSISDDIDVTHLAEVACITRPYLIRLFKRELGLSPLQYINKKKVERAQLMLLTEECSVKEVAYSLGFSDHSYFIRMFKKTTGTTPREYRMRML